MSNLIFTIPGWSIDVFLSDLSGMSVTVNTRPSGFSASAERLNDLNLLKHIGLSPSIRYKNISGKSCNCLYGNFTFSINSNL